MQVREIMKQFPSTARVDDTLEFARDLMVWRGVRYLPVLQDKKVVGILAEQDVVAYQSRVATDEHEHGGLTHPVGRAMSTQVQTAVPEESVEEAAARMAQHKVGCLPVIEREELVGLLTTSEILAAQVRELLGPAPRNGPTVADAMTPNPLTAHPDDHLLDAAARMQSNHIRHLPVIDGDGNIVGMLSDRDVRNAVGDPRRLAQGGKLPPSLDLMRVSQVMSSPAITVRVDEHLGDVARYFVGINASTMPVVDANHRLVGILSYIDLLSAFAGA